MSDDRFQQTRPRHMAQEPRLADGEAGSRRAVRAHVRAGVTGPGDVSGRGATMPAWLAVGFVSLALLVMAAPLALTPFAPATETAEKRALASFPRAIEEGRPNLDYLGQLGSWYADHFALRNALVDLDATLKERALVTSATDNVVVGTGGWLYYAGELNDWRRAAPMSDRAIANATHNLALVNEALSAQGKRFVVAIAPNKSTLYPGHMPPWLLAGSDPSNAERLGAALAERGVPYVNLLDALSAAERDLGGDLYLRRDSHWNNEGALVAAEALLDALGHPHVAWEDEAPEVDATHVGDLDAMLHPAGAAGEPQPLWSSAQAFSWAGEATDVEAPKLETTASADGSLLMFRDSFGNALLPYMASSYGHASFTKLVPYNMSTSALRGVGDVVVERAERHVSTFATQAPYLPAPEREGVVHDEPQGSRGHVGVAVNGPFLQIRGELDEDALPDGGTVLVELGFSDGSRATFEAFLLSAEAGVNADSEAVGASEGSDAAIAGDCGFCAYVARDAIGRRVPTRLTVLSTGGGHTLVAIGTAIDLGGQL